MSEFQEGPLNYVVKAWGSEVWMVNQSPYCLKQLFVSPGFQCSLHAHPLKEESFFVNSGSGLIQVEERIYHVREGAVVHIKPGTLHRFATLGILTLELLEVSTHHEDEDVLRAFDSCPFTSEEQWVKDYYQVSKK